MWEKIETKEMIADLTIGKIPTNNPNDSGKVYEIRSIGNAIIKANNKDGVVALKIFTEKELLSGNWFVKKL